MATKAASGPVRSLAALALVAASTLPGQASALERARDVRGALPDGAARVRVTMWHQDMRERTQYAIAETMSDDRGAFAFAAVPWPGEQAWGHHAFAVVARWPDHVAMTMLRGEQAKLDPVKLNVFDTTTIRGVVTDGRGDAVEGAVVWPRILGKVVDAEVMPVWLTAALPYWRTTTEADGTFELADVPVVDQLELTVEHDEFAYAHARTEDLTQPFAVELAFGCTISGTVSMPDGSPAIKVDVAASGTGWGRTATDAAGRFTLRGLPAGVYKVWAEAKDLTVIAIADLALEGGEHEQGQDIQLVHGGFIVGRILDATTGLPIAVGPYTDVAMYGPARPRGGACECTPVLQDGTFRIRAPAGANYIYLRGVEGASQSETVTVVEGEETAVEWRVRVPARGDK